MTELHALLLPAVLAADAELDVGTHFLCLLHRELHQTPHPHLIDRIEGIGRQYLLLEVRYQELARVVTAEAERMLFGL